MAVVVRLSSQPTAAGERPTEEDGSEASVGAAARAHLAWCAARGVVIDAHKFEARDDGLFAAAPIAALEVVATIPRRLALETPAGPGWAGRLTEAALAAQFDNLSDDRAEWIADWRGGGWGTDLEDLEPRDRASSVVGGSLISTGSDNDAEIYRKFGMPCHPVVDRAARRLSALCGASLELARASLLARGAAFRASRDRLSPGAPPDLVTSAALRLSARERRQLRVATLMSRAIARAASLGDEVVVVPVHELLQHCDEAGETLKLVGADPRSSAGVDSFLLVATRALARGDALTRDYAAAPRLLDAPPPPATPTGGSVARPPDEDDTQLRRILHSGLRQI